MISLPRAALALFLIGTVACGASGGEARPEGLDAPIVLAHGFAGFDRIAGIMDYWYGIPEALEADGAEVHVTQVSPANSSLVRGAQLLDQVEAIAAASAAGKVHLIGHSQGGIDARYVAGMRPDLVASITTVGTPHRLAEEFQIPSGPAALTVASAALGALGELISALSTNDQPNDAAGAVSFFDADAFAEFNARFPMGLPDEPCGEGPARVDGIRLYSWSGTALGTTALDPIDLLFTATGSIFDEPNDGLVERCSSHFGRVLRDDYGWNHLDEVNLMFGLVPETEVHPIAVFRAHVDRLRGIERTPAGLATDAAGRFAPSPATLALFRSALVAGDDEGTVRDRMRATIAVSLRGGAARDAEALFDRFLELRAASRGFSPSPPPGAWEPEAFEARLAELEALRARHLGRVAADALFGEEQAAQRAAIARFAAGLQGAGR